MKKLLIRLLALGSISSAFCAETKAKCKNL